MGPIVICYQSTKGVEEINLTGVHLANPLDKIILENDNLIKVMNTKTNIPSDKKDVFTWAEKKPDFLNEEYLKELNTQKKEPPPPSPAPATNGPIVKFLFLCNPDNNMKLPVRLKNNTYKELLNSITDKLKNLNIVKGSEDIACISPSDEMDIQLAGDDDIEALADKTTLIVKLKNSNK